MLFMYQWLLTSLGLICNIDLIIIQNRWALYSSKQIPQKGENSNTVMLAQYFNKCLWQQANLILYSSDVVSLIYKYLVSLVVFKLP